MLIGKAALVLGCLLISSARAQSGNCEVLNDTCVYIDEMGDVLSIDDDEAACNTQNKSCCWDQSAGICRNTIVGDRKPKGGGEVNPFVVPDSVKVDGKMVAQRNLVISNPLCIPTNPPSFPSGCKYAKNEPYVLYPPTNIPYCVRIPCALDTHKQSKLDRNHFACGSTPGCYFDTCLHEYREAFGPAVLAGVPVCHLAIRNSVFLQKAYKVINDYGSWSPYFTNCLLKTCYDEIYEGPPGCALIPLLTTFNFLPKLAGWEGITSDECALIGGCWSHSYGCQYPVDVNNLIVKSGQQFLFNKFNVIYGRPKCQHFNMENPYEILKSYHRCLASGCAVDVTISAHYYHYLFDIGDQMSVRDHWYYWAAVLLDRIGSYNLDTDIYWKYDTTFSRSLDTEPTEEPQTTAATNPFLVNDKNPFARPPGRRKRDVATTNFGSSKACGFAFRASGYRPCRPIDPPNLRPNTHCPYKPFFVPRFCVLKGSFAGCCEINHCYISRKDIRKMHSGPSIYYTEWTIWGDCSIACGVGGTQKRHRKCVAHDRDLCELDVVQTRSCGGQCNEWTAWGRWSPCPSGRRPSFTQQTRSRECRPDPYGCEGMGQAEESRLCPSCSNPWGC